MGIIFDQQTENHLAFSVEQYRELLHHAEKLVELLNDNNYSKIEEHVVKLQQLQVVANRQDEQLLPLLKRDLPTWEKHTLYQERLSCIKNIIECNELVTPKIQDVMAVTAAELGKLSGGRNALAGYASHVDKRGSLGIG